ncbi:hypothetical protein EMIT0357P_11205 [Pseudomonas marginalis]
MSLTLTIESFKQYKHLSNHQLGEVLLLLDCFSGRGDVVKRFHIKHFHRTVPADSFCLGYQIIVASAHCSGQIR